MTRLRLGVIGAGSWATVAHLPSLAALGEEVEFVAVSRHGDRPLTAVKERFGFQVASTDYRHVLDAGVDIVVVASPTAFHAEHTTAALEAGAHVLCEKPFTISSDDAWKTVHTAERLNRHLLLSFGWNYAPMIRRTIDLLAGGGIGVLENFSLTMSSQTRELLTDSGSYPDSSPTSAPEPATWTDPALSGGGYGQAQLSHALALALSLTGARVDGAFALMSGPTESKVELHDAFSLRLTDGAIASVGGASSFTGADSNKHHLCLEAVGDQGQLIVDVFRERVSLYRPGVGQVDLDVERGEGAYDASLAARCLVDLAIGRTSVNPAPGELGARTVEALELAYRSARSGQFEMRTIE